MILNIYKGTTLSQLVYRLKTRRLGPVPVLDNKIVFLITFTIAVGHTAERY